jgi:hypothetical protein
MACGLGGFWVGLHSRIQLIHPIVLVGTGSVWSWPGKFTIATVFMLLVLTKGMIRNFFGVGYQLIYCSATPAPPAPTAASLPTPWLDEPVVLS